LRRSDFVSAGDFTLSSRSSRPIYFWLNHDVPFTAVPVIGLASLHVKRDDAVNAVNGEAH